MGTWLMLSVPPATIDIRHAAQNSLGRHRNGLQARGAKAIDRDPGTVSGKPGPLAGERARCSFLATLPASRSPG